MTEGRALVSSTRIFNADLLIFILELSECSHQ